MGRDRRRDSRAENRNIGIQQERLHGDTLLATDADCCKHRRQFKFELKIAVLHMLSRTVFFEKHWPQKLPIHGLYAGVARDSCLPCKRYCRAASRAAASRAPVALLVAFRVNVPWESYDIGFFLICIYFTLDSTVQHDGSRWHQIGHLS